MVKFPGLQIQPEYAVGLAGAEPIGIQHLNGSPRPDDIVTHRRPRRWIGRNGGLQLVSLSHLAEELGDVLLQVGLHSQIGSDEGTFTIDDVLHAINSKLLRRHPHVFGDVEFTTAEEVADNWQLLKDQERGTPSESVLDGVTESLPALAHSQEIQRRAGKLGFEWDHIDGVIDKVREELDEFKNAKSTKEHEHELGDILASLVNVARWVDVDAETAVRNANKRFGRRFRHMERAASQSGCGLSALSLVEKEALWQQAKREVG